MKIVDVEGIMLRLADRARYRRRLPVHPDHPDSHRRRHRRHRRGAHQPAVSKAILDAPLCSVSANGLAPPAWRGPARHRSALGQDLPPYGDLRAARRADACRSAASTSRCGTFSAKPPACRSIGCSAAAARRVDGLCQRPVAARASTDTLALARTSPERGLSGDEIRLGRARRRPARGRGDVAAIRAEIGDDIDLMIDMGRHCRSTTRFISAAPSPIQASFSSRSPSRRTTSPASRSSSPARRRRSRPAKRRRRSFPTSI